MQNWPANFGGIIPHSCQFCDKIKIDTRKCFVDDDQHPLSPQSFSFSNQEVVEAAKKGCHVFKERLRRLDGPRQDVKLLEVQPLLFQDRALLSFFWYTGDPRYPVSEEELSLFARAGSPASSYVVNRPLQCKTSFETTKRWLQECENHHRCKRFQNPPGHGHMPKRVIFVGSTSADTIRLEDLNEGVPKRYCALSYCWGRGMHNKQATTRATLSERQSDVIFDQLPKTLQDAVDVTRHLGFQYLWVDSLCIIQDDETDKNTEIANMSHIYRNATVTISAARAVDCNEGFLHEHDLAETYRDIYEFRFSTDPDNGDSGTVYCSEGDIRRCTLDPIDKRAWTMQEHELSPRLLRFGGSQMIWKCPEVFKVDGGSNDVEDPVSHDTGKGEILNEWMRTVEKYTARCIKHPEDRLPAIAALAEKTGKSLGSGADEYVAGLWKQGMPFMLLWYVSPWQKENTCRGLLNGASRSPTWSWHLARSGVGHPRRNGSHSEASLEIQEYNVSLATTVQYGRVSKGTLVVLGFLQKVQWTGSSFMKKVPGDMDDITSIKEK
ncbi:heterokaryon incompatibility protein-domain-containing protein [Ilyonectria destructans]|nr:heterokaryon incompatibility protein-domain-containing protein [Ilyonectria destructans]